MDNQISPSVSNDGKHTRGAHFRPEWLLPRHQLRINEEISNKDGETIPRVQDL